MPARTLPNLGLKAGYDPGENGWGDDMTLNLLKLSVLSQGSVISTVSTTPGSPAANDTHIFDETHATQPNKIAVYDDGAWVYLTPLEGWRIYDRAANSLRYFNGTLWAAYSSGGGGATVLDDLTDVVAPTPADGDALVWDSGTSKWIPAVVGGGTPVGWEIVGTYDFAVDGALASKDFTDLGDYMELKITGRVGTSVSASIQFQLSADNGTTFYSTSGDYYTLDGNAVDSAASTVMATAGGGAVAGSKTVAVSISGNGSTVTALSSASALARRMTVSATFNALKVLASTGTMNSGSFTVWGMRAA